MDKLSSKGLVISGKNLAANLVEMVELADHPWFVACQFHPEFKSKPFDCHPLFKSFIANSLKNKKSKVMSLYDDILRSKIFFILGPCVLDTENNAEKIAQKLKGIREDIGPVIFKASFDKANRQSVDSYRGPGIKKGLQILKDIKEKFALPILTDIH
jgi:hypothetical protein